MVPRRLWVKLEKKASFEYYTENLEKSERQLNQTAVSVQTSQLASVCLQKQRKRRLTCVWQSFAITTFWNVHREEEDKSQSEDTADGIVFVLYGSFSFKTFTLHIHRLKSEHYRRN